MNKEDHRDSSQSLSTQSLSRENGKDEDWSNNDETSKEFKDEDWTNDDDSFENDFDCTDYDPEMTAYEESMDRAVHHKGKVFQGFGGYSYPVYRKTDGQDDPDLSNAKQKETERRGYHSKRVIIIDQEYDRNKAREKNKKHRDSTRHKIKARYYAKQKRARTLIRHANQSSKKYANEGRFRVYLSSEEKREIPMELSDVDIHHQPLELEEMIEKHRAMNRIHSIDYFNNLDDLHDDDYDYDRCNSTFCLY